MPFLFMPHHSNKCHNLRLEVSPPKPASLRQSGKLCCHSNQLSSKGFSLPFLTSPYPTALSGFGTLLPSQSLSQRRLLGAPFSNTVTLIQPRCGAGFFIPCSLPRGKKKSGAKSSRLRESETRPSVCLDSQIPTQEGAGVIPCPFSPVELLEPSFPVQPTIVADLSKHASQTLSTSPFPPTEAQSF